MSLVGGADAVSALLSEVDGNGDGVIDFDEFMALMNKDAAPPEEEKKKKR